MKKLVLITSSLTLSAAVCAGDADISKPLPRVEARRPVTQPTNGEPKTVEFSIWKSALLVNDIAGRLNEGMFCGSAFTLHYSKKLDDIFRGIFTVAYKEEALKAGYASPEAESVFENSGSTRSSFRLGATLEYLDYRSCGAVESLTGGAYAKVRWELFSARRQKVIYVNTIDGSLWTDSSMPGRDFDKRFAANVINNLFADPKFAEAVRTDNDTNIGSAAVLRSMSIAPGHTYLGELSRDAGSALPAVVTIDSGVGVGSGFFISQDGYLLTNQHVVGDAKFVRVKLRSGRSLVGEVIRSDKARDVALVRTDSVSSPVLQPRPGSTRVGEDVYALGSPFGEELSGTLTRGVLSSQRILNGIAYLQSDAAINPGNSGGPLLDKDGRVLGIACLSTDAKGIALFVPIDEALEKLALTIEAPAKASAR